MIKAIKNPQGLNATVHRIQVAMHNAFDKSWSDKDDLGADTQDGIICYPICFVNFKKSNRDIEYNKKILEYFDDISEEEMDVLDKPVGDNTDYIDILDGEMNRMIVLSDYEIEQVNDTPNFETTRLEVIVIVDLQKAYPLLRQRPAAVEQARSEVTKILEKIPNVSIHKTIRKLNKVFGEIQYSVSLDLHPLHCFKVVLIVDRFSKNDKICN